MNQKVYEVTDVKFYILESYPPQLVIEAEGIFSSSGWTNPQLVPASGSGNDGIYKFDFVAEAPTGINIPVLTKTFATTRIKDVPDDLKGIEIIAQQNSIKEEIASPSVHNGPMSRILEPLLGYTVLDDKLILRVRTNGCTDKDDFVIDIQGGLTGQPPYFVSIYRINEDRCRVHKPEGIELTYTFKELAIKNGTDLIIINKVGRKFPVLDVENIPEFGPSYPRSPWEPWDPPFPWPFPQFPIDPRNPFDPRNPHGPAGPRPINPYIRGVRIGGFGI